MLEGDLLTHVRVVETELVAAVVANSHGGRSKPDDLDLVGMAAFGAVRMVASMDRDQRRPHDRVWAIRTHTKRIGSLVRWA